MHASHHHQYHYRQKYQWGISFCLYLPTSITCMRGRSLDICRHTMSIFTCKLEYLNISIFQQFNSTEIILFQEHRIWSNICSSRLEKSSPQGRRALYKQGRRPKSKPVPPQTPQLPTILLSYYQLSLCEANIWLSVFGALLLGLAYNNLLYSWPEKSSLQAKHVRLCGVDQTVAGIKPVFFSACRNQSKNVFNTFCHFPAIYPARPLRNKKSFLEWSSWSS